MKLHNLLKNSAGIGMVEVMMAIALSGGLALTVAKLMDNASQNTKVIEAKSEVTNLKGIVQNILTNTTACSYTFGPIITQGNLTTLGGSTSASVAVPSIKDKTNTIKYSTASNNINPLTITSIALTNYNSGAGTADLLIQLTFNKSAGQTLLAKPIRIPLNFNINNTVPASPVLVGCSTMAVGGEWMLGGNAGTNEASDYLGTSDNVPLNFKVNAQRAARIDHIKENAYFGYNAGSTTSSAAGTANVAVGNLALQANTSGAYNVAVGSNSLRQSAANSGNVAVGPNTMWVHNSGDFNTAIGFTSMQMSTTSYQNTAIGAISLRQITSGSLNSAVGYSALNMTTTGSNNTAMGHQSLTANSTGIDNVGIGVYALGSNTVANQNTAVGMEAGSRVVSNGSNTYVGFRAGYQTTGASNTMFGNETGFSNTSGSANIFLGYRAGYSETGSNKLHINNGLSTTSLIEGDFTSAARFVKFDGTTIIGANNTNNSANKNSLIQGNANILQPGANGSAIMGHSNTVGSTSYVMGVGNVTGTSSWLTHAFGQSNTVTGNASMAFGWNNNVSGQRSFVMGAASSASADYTWVFGIDSTATHSGAMVLSDYGSGGAASWGYDTFTARFQGGYRFHTDYSGTTGVQLSGGGSAWGTISDRNAKENFKEIDLEEHLRKIAKMPVSKWNYKGQKKIPHIGPMAQDFYYIFKLGDGNDKMITTQDMEGVTIVGVKALEERTRKLQKENEDLKKRIERLEALILKQQ